MVTVVRLFILGILCSSLAPVTRASEIKEGELASKFVPATVPYGVILPDGYGSTEKPLPLLILLHGGGGSHEDLQWWKPAFDDLWTEGKLPKMVVAMASVGASDVDHRARYMDFKDGSERWESFLVEDFLHHVRRQFNVSDRREDTVIGGISDGGFGSLKMAFKYPDRFAGIAAFEPAILPALRWKDVTRRNHFFISPALLTRYYGMPIDEDYWAINNPATIAKVNAAKIRASKLAIYIECGDEDFLNLHEGGEFLHQVLWSAQIPHEYHLVRGADHIGRTLPDRTREGLAFLKRALQPPEQDTDPDLQQMKDLFRELKNAGERDAPRRIRSGEGQD